MKQLRSAIAYLVLPIALAAHQSATPQANLIMAACKPRQAIEQVSDATLPDAVSLGELTTQRLKPAVIM